MKLRRHIWKKFNAGTALLLAIVIVLMLNYLSFRHYHWVDSSEKQFYSLSSKTISLLKTLETPVEITFSFQEGNVLYNDVCNLLKEYRSHSLNKMLIFHQIDPDKDLAKADEIKNKYKVTEPNVVIFECDGRIQYVREDDIATINASSGIKRITAFKGEQAFSSALLGVIQETVPLVYFLTGHGERDIENFDPRTGFSRVGELIERDNIELRPLLLSTQKQVPSDCVALIVAGVSQYMSASEAELIGSWLSRGGRLMVLTDAGQRSGLEPLLHKWGVLLRNDLVFDLKYSRQIQDVHIASYTQHPITEKLSNIAAVFYRPRSVEPDYKQLKTNAADRPKVTPIARTSENGWSETQLDQIPAQYDKETSDLAGSISMAVAVEKGSSTGRFDIQIRPTRIVVFGDSDFISNSGITGPNQTLFMSSLSWLLDREHLMEITPKPMDDTRLKLTHADIQTLFWSIVWGVPLLTAAPGLVLWIRRRK